MRPALVFLMLASLGCDAAGASPSSPPRQAQAQPAPPPQGTSPFLKGQLHTHSSGSGDSDTPPAEVVAWYAERGYDFVVLTDHNRVTETPAPLGMLVLRGVELTQNLRTCEPPPSPGDACLLHLNALFVVRHPEPIVFDPPASLKRTALYGRAFGRGLGLGGVVQLNHPNFQGGADLEVLVALAQHGLSLVEIANQAYDSNNEGGGGRLSTEALWDGALSRGVHVFGTATDDAHHYGDAPRVRARGEIPYTGDRGWVMVRAAARTEAAIRAAIVAGDFHASTGVVLDALELGPGGLVVEPRPDGAPYTFEVISGGRVVSRTQGASLRFDPRSAVTAPGYSRVRVTDGAGRRAWTQPVWL